MGSDPNSLIRDWNYSATQATALKGGKAAAVRLGQGCGTGA